MATTGRVIHAFVYLIRWGISRESDGIVAGLTGPHAAWETTSALRRLPTIVQATRTSHASQDQPRGVRLEVLGAAPLTEEGATPASYPRRRSDVE